MSCSSFTLWVVSDDVEDRQRAEEHAAVCPECRAILQGQRVLQERVTEWEEIDEAPPGVEERVRRAIADVARRPLASPHAEKVPEIPKRRYGLWLALAASFLIGIGLGVFKLPASGDAPQETRRLLDAGALEIAQEEEAAQRRAIVGLEEEAATILARAKDKELASHRAARLMEYKSRLAMLDVTIDDVQGFVLQNPGHPRARNMLLDAYREKTDILREVIALEERSS